jgi:DNA-binding transcriptional regulator YiaG
MTPILGRPLSQTSMTNHPTRSRADSSARNPTPEEVRAAREVAGLSQSAAAARVYSTRRTWQDWEAGIARMHPGLFELFLIKSIDSGRHA